MTIVEVPTEAPPETTSPSLIPDFSHLFGNFQSQGPHYSQRDANTALNNAAGYVEIPPSSVNLLVQDLFNWSQVYFPELYNAWSRGDWNHFTKLLRDPGNAARVASEATQFAIRWVNIGIYEGVRDAFNEANAIARTVNHNIAVLNGRITAVQNYILGKLATESAQRVKADKALASFAYTAVAQVSTDLKKWTFANVLVPLSENIGKVAAQAKTYTDAKTAQSQQATLAKVAAELAPIAATATAALAIASQVKTWVDDCGDPMCQTQGPKTDLGKLLKSLKLAKFLALLIAAEALDAKTLEELALGIGTLEGHVGEWAAKAIFDALSNVPQPPGITEPTKVPNPIDWLKGAI